MRNIIRRLLSGAYGACPTFTVNGSPVDWAEVCTLFDQGLAPNLVFDGLHLPGHVALRCYMRFGGTERDLRVIGQQSLAALDGDQPLELS